MNRIEELENENEEQRSKINILGSQIQLFTRKIRDCEDAAELKVPNFFGVACLALALTGLYSGW